MAWLGVAVIVIGAGAAIVAATSSVHKSPPTMPRSRFRVARSCPAHYPLAQWSHSRLPDLSLSAPLDRSMWSMSHTTKFSSGFPMASSAMSPVMAPQDSRGRGTGDEGQALICFRYVLRPERRSLPCRWHTGAGRRVEWHDPHHRRRRSIWPPRCKRYSGPLGFTRSCCRPHAQPQWSALLRNEHADLPSFVSPHVEDRSSDRHPLWR